MSAVGTGYDEANRKVFKFREPTPAAAQGLQRFFNTGMFSDLTIVAPDGQKLLVHQVVLAACSKRFSDVLEEGSLQGEELPVRGVDAGALDTILRFFYSGECCLNYTNVIPVYDAAHRLDVPSLMRACEQFCHEALAPSTACTLLQQAQHFLMQDFSDACQALVRSHFEEVTLRHSDFLGVTFQTLARILADAASSQADEGLVFRAAWRWGTAQLAHMQFLPQILGVVKVPADMSIEELMKLSTAQGAEPGTGTGQEQQGETGAAAAAAAAAAAQPAWPALQQVLLQHLLAGADIGTAVRNVAEEAAAVSLASLATEGADKAAGAGGTDLGAVGQGSMDAALPPQLQAAQLLEQAGVLGAGGGGVGELLSQAQAQGRDDDPMSQAMLGSPSSFSKYMGMSMQGGGLAGMPPYSISGQRTAKGQCQVEGCYSDLAGLRDYHSRYRICDVHLKAPSIIKEGYPQRFCQQCGRFHPLEDFDGDKRSCRARLQKHNARRRKRGDDGTPGGMQLDTQGMGGGGGGGGHYGRMDLQAYQLAGGFFSQQQQQVQQVQQRGGGEQPELSPSLALALLANAAQQQDGASAAAAASAAAVAFAAAGGKVGGTGTPRGLNQDAAALALSALGALAAAQDGQGGAGGLEGTPEAAAAQQLLAELAAGNGLAAWQLSALQGGGAGSGQMDPGLEQLLALAALPRSAGGMGEDTGHAAHGMEPAGLGAHGGHEMGGTEGLQQQQQQEAQAQAHEGQGMDPALGAEG